MPCGTYDRSSTTSCRLKPLQDGSKIAYKTLQEGLHSLAMRIFLILAPLLSSAVIIPVPLTCAPNCLPAITSAITACESQNPCTVQLDTGIYPLVAPAYSSLFNINNAQNFVFQGAGEDTVLQLKDIATVFSISGGANVTFSSFTIDHYRVPFTFGLSTGDGPQGSELTFDPSQYPINLTEFPWQGRAQSVLGYDIVKGRVSAPPNVTDIYSLDNPIPLTYLSPSVLRLEGTHLKQGQWMILRHQVYSYNAFGFYGTAGVTVQQVTLLSLGGMGIYTDRCTGITIDGLQIKKAPGRPMSICADGVHFSNTRGGAVVVQNSLFEGQGDDGINIPTIFQAIGWVSADGLSIQVQGRGQPLPASPLASSGDTLNVFNSTSLAPLGTSQVASIGPNHTIVLSTPLPQGSGVYSLVNVAQEYPSTTLIFNNTFKNNRARGALLKVSNMLATGNTFEGTTLPAIKTETDGCYWLEGHPVANWSVQRNTFNECNLWLSGGDIEVDNSVPVMKGGVPVPNTCTSWKGMESQVQHNLNISGNTFTSLASAIHVVSTDGVEVLGNTITRGGTSPPQYDIWGEGTINANVQGNVCDGGSCVISGL